MNSRELARYLVLGGALAGLTAGTQLRANTISLADSANTTAQTLAKKDAAAPDKHACKGLNSCKGQGSCKAGDNGCAGKNSCSGKGGCATDGSKK